MDQSRELIPPPPVIRERLARNIKEARMLRSLLRLSIQAARDRQSGSVVETAVYVDRPERAAS